MAYVFNGHESEGFYDILTGRPRYPTFLYNQVRQDRVDARRGHYDGRRPGNLTSSLEMPQGQAHTVPNLDTFLSRAVKGR